jgi:hypothetical protein
LPHVPRQRDQRANSGQNSQHAQQGAYHHAQTLTGRGEREGGRAGRRYPCRIHLSPGGVADRDSKAGRRGGRGVS